MSFKIIKKILFPLILFVSFFAIQVFLKPSEIVLTLLALLLTIIIFSIKSYKHEFRVFMLGLLLGFFVEVVLGLFARQQHWDNASLFGVPIWLPIIWGIGFVVITRVGSKIEKI